MKQPKIRQSKTYFTNKGTKTEKVLLINQMSYRNMYSEALRQTARDGKSSLDLGLRPVPPITEPSSFCHP